MELFFPKEVNAEEYYNRTEMLQCPVGDGVKTFVNGKSNAKDGDVGGQNQQYARGAGAQRDPAHNYDALKKCLDLCPSVDEMRQLIMVHGSLKKALLKVHVMLYPLLVWCVTSNRAYFRLLKPEERFRQMKTDYQFVFANAPPEKEKRFQELKKVHGSRFLWHGSGSFNWHTILRIGLKNMSRTKYMSAGAAFGNGIYFASGINTSLGYCRPANSWPKSKLGNSITIMTLSEVIDKKSYNKGGGLGSTIFVVPDEESVITRFLFVWDSKKGNAIKAPGFDGNADTLGKETAAVNIASRAGNITDSTMPAYTADQQILDLTQS